MTGPELREPELPRTAKVRTGPLRSGWMTGTCSAAAAKAATTALLTQRVQTAVEVALPDARVVPFAVERCEVGPARAEAVVVKDAGDDPDVTHGAHLTATVRWSDAPGVHLEGGIGVGVVTKPGLGLEVGGPAINPVPRRLGSAERARDLLGFEAGVTSGEGVRDLVSWWRAERARASYEEKIS